MDDVETIIMLYYTPVERKYIRGKSMTDKEIRQLVALGYDLPCSASTDNLYNAVLHSNVEVARRLYTNKLNVAFNAAIAGDSILFTEICALGGGPDARTDECIGYSRNPRKFRAYIQSVDEVMKHAACAGNIMCMLMLKKQKFDRQLLFNSSFGARGHPNIAKYLGGYPSRQTNWISNVMYSMDAKALVRAIAYGGGYNKQTLLTSLNGCQTVSYILSFLIPASNYTIRFARTQVVHKLPNITNSPPQEIFDILSRHHDIEKLAAFAKHYIVDYTAAYHNAARNGWLDQVQLCKPYCDDHSRAKSLARQFGHGAVYKFINSSPPDWRISISK